MTRIDTPQLDEMYITFLNQIDFVCPQLAQFINCTPKLRALDKARVRFDESIARVKLGYRSSQTTLDGLEIAISCREPDWQLSSIEQVCNSSLHPLSTVEDLYIERQYSELLLPFTAVKNLYLSKEFAPDIAPALEGLVVGGITEVLPRLQNIFVEWFEPSGPFQKNIGQFVAARQLSGHPIAISDWRRYR